MACSSASTSGLVFTQKGETPPTSSSSSESPSSSSSSPRRFCVNEIPWKLVPQVCQEDIEYEFLDEKERRLADVESFVWKWSPCGRYGIDLPGGRENINHDLKKHMAMFDLHANTWTLYTMDSGHFEIPRVCFLYWARHDIIGTVTLVKDFEPGPDDEIPMKFKQSFYYVSHETQTLIHAGSCKYRTNKTIVASYWYHIFENRRGEPFADQNNHLWLVFSNGADSLILIPFIPTDKCFKAKFVSFDMNEIVGKMIGTRVYLDPFMSSHFVPFVYRNDINFFIRIDSYSFIEEHDRDYSIPDPQENQENQANRGVFQIRVNLRNVLERGINGEAQDPESIETRFGPRDVELWRRISEDSTSGHFHQCFSQHGKMVVVQRWAHFSIDLTLSKKLGTRISDLGARDACCSQKTRDVAFWTIDLDSERIKAFDTLLLGTDVILPHPTGTMFMFRYKENYAMSFCELPYFEPISLKLKCLQVLSGCVNHDPTPTMCCLKKEEEEES
uniref:Uncharacterized protein n=1 Tax=Caenorhabditis tropicalis TaxID=1561998 RepID=A0A1I7U662_9PELO